MEKIKLKENVEFLLRSSSYIPNKDEILKSLKGYSLYTEKVEGFIDNESLYNNWIFIGKLMIHMDIFKKDIKRDEIKDLFINDKKYFIIYNENDFEKLINFNFNNTSLNVDPKIESFYSKLNIKKSEKFTEDLIIFFSNKFEKSGENKGKDRFDECMSFSRILEFFKGQSIIEKEIIEALSIGTNISTDLKYRKELFELFKDDGEIINILKRVSNQKINKVKSIKTKDKNKLKEGLLSK